MQNIFLYFLEKDTFIKSNAEKKHLLVEIEGFDE